MFYLVAGLVLASYGTICREWSGMANTAKMIEVKPLCMREQHRNGPRPVKAGQHKTGVYIAREAGLPGTAG